MIWLRRHAIEEPSLDTTAFAIDAILFTLVGISWHELLVETAPQIIDFWGGLWHLEILLWWGALMGCDFVVLRLSHGAVFMLYLFLRWRRDTELDCGARKGREDVGAERAPLLA